MPFSFTIWVIHSVSFIEREFINVDMQDVIIQMMLWEENVQNVQSEYCWYPGQCFSGWSGPKQITPRNALMTSHQDPKGSFSQPASAGAVLTRQGRY